MIMILLLFSPPSPSIGYPVVTMSFQLKHQLTHVIRQRQQRSVSEENSKCFEILCKALPVEEDDGSEEGNGGKVGGATTSEDSPNQSDAKGKSHVKVVAKATSGSKGYGLNGKTQNAKGSTTLNNNNGISKTISGTFGGVVTKRDSSPSTKNQETKAPSSPGIIGGVAPSPWKLSEVELIPNGGPVGNGELPRPPSAGKQLHPPTFGLKKQALVKAVPRTDLQQQMDAREKVSDFTL